MKFKIIKRFALDFIGNEWKECYINFNGLTIRDIRDQVPAIANISNKNQKDIIDGMDKILNLIKSKFITGKAINSEGKLVDLKANDLDDLPTDVLVKALNFLSQGETEVSALPSKKS